MSSERYGQYELVKKLATGGMAQIYLARHRGIEGFERLCVVKRILPHLAENDDFVQMFLDEAKIAARLNHPNIVQIYDLGEQDDSYYIAMEYIHGEDLRRMWRRAEQRGDALPVPLVLRIIADAASGLDYAHKRTDASGRPLNIVHRDISPQNILVSFEGTVKVVDFGIAKAADKATHTRSGVLKGKYSYMSPEQAGGSRDVDRRTDIFALGVVLYELLTGQRLFKRNNDVQTLQAVMTCQVQPPSQANERVPRSLDEVVLKALTQSPEDRYGDAMAFQLALENWLIEHQQPSSTAHVAAYLKELYADRLANEAPNGAPLAEEVRTPSSRVGRSSTGGGRAAGGSSASAAGPHRESGAQHSAAGSFGAGGASSSGDGHGSAAPGARPEHTTSLRPERPSRGHPQLKSTRSTTSPQRVGNPAARPLTELPAETSPRVTEVSRASDGGARGRSKGPLIGAVLAAVALLAVGLWWSFGGSAQPAAQVTVLTDPPGARLVWDGMPVLQATPTILPPRAEGTYALRITRDGFREELLTVSVPKTGALQVGPVRLSELPPPVMVSGDGQKGPTGTTVAREVEVELVTEPSGAALTVNGRSEGTSPVRMKVAPGTELNVRAELSGHVAAERRIVAAQAGGRELVAKLERRRTNAGSGSSTSSGSGSTQNAGATQGQTGQGTVAAAGSSGTGSGSSGAGTGTAGSGSGSGSGTSAPPTRATGSVLFFVASPLGDSAYYSCNGAPFQPLFDAVQLPAGSHDCLFRHEVRGTVRKTIYVRPGQDTQREPVRFE